MEAINEILANIAAASGALIPILYTLLIAAGLDFLSGVFSAWKSGTLEIEFIAEFIKSHILFKVGPIMLQLLAGVAVGGTDSVAGLALIATGGAEAALYLAASLASIRGNLSQAGTETKGLPSGVLRGTVLVESGTVEPAG